MESSDRLYHHCDHYRDHRYSNLDHRLYRDGADVCIVGAGAAGGVLALELCRAGLKVVLIEAGPYWAPQTDFASDELTMSTTLGWMETRYVGGSDPLTLGHNNCGRGVGGGTTHFTGVMFRLHPSDFRTRSLDGVGDDWPISYDDLAGYYERIERDIAISGPKEFPWGAFHGPYPYPEREPISANAQIFRAGCERLGITSVVAPLAINSAPFDGRPPCINRGFCNQGCLPNAKFSTLVHHIPKAVANGAELLSDCMVTRINMGSDGAVAGVTFVHDRKRYEQRARVVVLASFVIETPRLLLASACPAQPRGLANSSGMVGRAFMPHSSHDVYAKFPYEIRFYKGTPVLATTQEFYETDPERGFKRGYTLHAHGARPVTMAKGLAKSAKLWGQSLADAMRDFNFYARITLVGEVLPEPSNQIILSNDLDEYGVPVPLVEFGYGANDKRLYEHGIAKAKEILRAAGGEPAFVTNDTAHLMGGCRMGDDPSHSVVTSYGQSHDIPNLWITGAPIFVTGGGGNPTETVMALALRTAEGIIGELNKGAV